MRPPFNWTRRFERRARIAYNKIRRSAKTDGSLLRWNDWVCAMIRIEGAAIAGEHAKRSVKK